MDRYLIPANGPEIEPIKMALELAGELGQNIGGQVEVTLVTPSKSLSGTSFESVVGHDVVKELEKGSSIKLYGNVYIRMESERTLNVWDSYSILLVLYSSKRTLDKIDTIMDCVHTIVVPWTMEEVEEWEGTWKPRIFGDQEPHSEIINNNPVVEEAMKLLTDTVNLSTGLSHPSDKAVAVELFKALYKNRELFDPVSVKAWALRNGWNPSGANQVRDIAEAINNRRSIRGGTHPHLQENIIEILRERVRSRD